MACAGGRTTKRPSAEMVQAPAVVVWHKALETQPVETCAEGDRGSPAQVVTCLLLGGRAVLVRMDAGDKVSDLVRRGSAVLGTSCALLWRGRRLGIGCDRNMKELFIDGVAVVECSARLPGGMKHFAKCLRPSTEEMECPRPHLPANLVQVSSSGFAAHLVSSPNSPNFGEQRTVSPRERQVQEGW